MYSTYILLYYITQIYYFDRFFFLQNRCEQSNAEWCIHSTIYYFDCESVIGFILLFCISQILLFLKNVLCERHKNGEIRVIVPVYIFYSENMLNLELLFLFEKYQITFCWIKIILLNEKSFYLICFTKYACTYYTKNKLI